MDITSAFVISLAISSVVDALPRPAFASYSGCRLKSGSKIEGCECNSNDGIQMGETWANTRVIGQLSGFFLVYKPGEHNYDSEGGPYGIGIGCNCYPKETDMVQSDNLADFCFFWHPKNNTSAGVEHKKGNSTENALPKVIPGEKATPMPIVCPSNLKNCYSANYYEPGGPLAEYADLKPTYRGPWFPLKDRSTREPLFCHGLNLGCPTPTNLELQLQRLPSVKCDVTKCKVPGENSTSTA